MSLARPPFVTSSATRARTSRWSGSLHADLISTSSPTVPPASSMADLDGVDLIARGVGQHEHGDDAVVQQVLDKYRLCQLGEVVVRRLIVAKIGDLVLQVDLLFGQLCSAVLKEATDVVLQWARTENDADGQGKKNCRYRHQVVAKVDHCDEPSSAVNRRAALGNSAEPGLSLRTCHPVAQNTKSCHHDPTRSKKLRPADVDAIATIRPRDMPATTNNRI